MRARYTFGTLDGYIVAINAQTGEEEWRKLTVDPDMSYTITSAPRIIKGMVVIGNSGAEKSARGYLGAYDADTGEVSGASIRFPATQSLVLRHRRWKWRQPPEWLLVGAWRWRHRLGFRGL